MNFQGFKFAPRIRDLKKKLYPLSKKRDAITRNLSSIIGGTVNTQLMLRIMGRDIAIDVFKKGVVPSLGIIKTRKLSRQNSLQLLFVRLVRLNRTIFTFRVDEIQI